MEHFHIVAIAADFLIEVISGMQAEGVFDVGDSGKLLYDFRSYGDVNKAKSFIMPLAVLRRLVRSSSILRGAYEALLNAADVPADAGEDYCLLMEFEDE